MAKNRSTSKNTLIVMISTLVSRILGYVRTMILANYFGIAWQADVLNGVFSIPNNLRKLMAEGALSSAFIPALSGAQEKGQREAKKLTQSLIGFQLAILIPLGVIVVLFSYPIINTLLVYDTLEKRQLAADIFRYFIWYLPLVSISAVIMAVLNVRKRFLLTSITPIIFSISVITSIIVFYKTLGVYGMVIGVMGGGILQILIQLPLFLKERFSLIPRFSFSSPEMKGVIYNWLPIMVTSSIFTINQVIANNLASRLGEGRLAAFSYAIVFWQLPYGLFTNATTTVLFPKMSTEVATGRLADAKKTMFQGLTNLLTFQLPSTFYLIIAGLPLIAVSLQRGNFTPQGALLTYQVLTQFSFGLFFVGAYNFTNRYFYSKNQYMVPLQSALIILTFDVGLSLWLMKTPLGVSGLALANSLSFFFGLIFLFLHKDMKVSIEEFKPLLIIFGKIIAALLIPLIFLHVMVKALSATWLLGSTLRGFALLALVSILFGISVLGFYYLFKIDFIMKIIRKRKK